MSALAAGRGISLPSLAAAGASFCAWSSGAYGRVREQFNRPIGRFEGIQDRLGALASRAYVLDAARRLTCAGLDAGYKPAIVSAIMKAQATDRLRDSVNDAMDIHGGKAVMDGPLNYLGDLHRSVPIAITVEGANILTRNLIIFGQGAIRCHPWLLKEMEALSGNGNGEGNGKAQTEDGLQAFDEAFWGHVRHSLATLGRAWLRSWSGAALSPAPADPGARRYFKKLGRYAAAFALTADMALLTLGGGLKSKEMLSARLGDVLSELYLLSAVLKRWKDEGSQPEDMPLVAYCMEQGFKTIEQRLHEVYRNLPNRAVGLVLGRLIFPLGPGANGPSDALAKDCAAILLTPGDARDRLCHGLYLGSEDDDTGVTRLKRAFDLVIEAADAEKRLREAGIRDWREAEERSVLTAKEAGLVRRAREAVALALAVDDFPASTLARSESGAASGETEPQDGQSGTVAEFNLAGGN